MFAIIIVSTLVLYPPSNYTTHSEINSNCGKNSRKYGGWKFSEFNKFNSPLALAFVITVYKTMVTLSHW